MGTGIKEFMEAVIKIRPELFDSYQPELHVKPEPAPEPAPAAAPAPPVPEPETEPEPEPAPVIRFCPYCGALAESYRFCAKCGRQLLK